MTKSIQFEYIEPIIKKILGGPLPVLVKAKAMRSLEEADQILKEARLCAQKELDDAQNMAESIKEAARAEGLKQAAFETTTMLLKAQQAKTQFIIQAQKSLKDEAIELTKILIGTSVKDDSRWLEELVQTHLTRSNSQKTLRITCHPDDRETIAKGAQKAGMDKNTGTNIIIDPSITRGGFRISSEMGEMDATVEGRLEMLFEALRELQK